MEFKNSEAAQSAIQEFARLVLEAQVKCGLEEEVVAIIHANVCGNIETTMYGSGNIEEWRGMLEAAMENLNRVPSAKFQV